METRLRFVWLHLNNPQDFWNDVLWTEEEKVEMFGHNALKHVWSKPNKAYKHKHLVPTVRRDGGGAMIRAYFAASGPAHLTVNELRSELFFKLKHSRVKCEAR